MALGIYECERSTQEIDAVLEACDARQGRWPGMTYEEGVRAALLWVLGIWDDNPIEEDAPAEDGED